MSENDTSPYAADIATPQEVGMTNSELMRYRLTGELPERAEAANAERFKAQTGYTPLAIDILLKLRGKPERLVVSGKESTSSPLQTEESKITSPESALAMLSQLSASLDTVETDAEFIKDVESIAKKFDKFLYDFDTRSDTTLQFMKNESQLRGQIIDKIGKSIHAPSVPIEAKIALLTACAKFENASFSDNTHTGKTKKILIAEYEAGNIDLIAAIFAKKTPLSYEAYDGIRAKFCEDTIPQLNTDTLIKMSKPTIDFFSYTLERNGLEDIFDLSGTITSLVQELKNKHEDAVVESLFADIVDSFKNQIDRIKGGSPSHAKTQRYLDMFRLFPRPQQLPDALLPLLKKLYQEKSVRYRGELKYDFERTAWHFGIPFHDLAGG